MLMLGFEQLVLKSFFCGEIKMNDSFEDRSKSQFKQTLCGQQLCLMQRTVAGTGLAWSKPKGKVQV
jgi:hypothetical protein